MNVFASYFWLWSIIGIMCAMLLYTLGALMNLGGFSTPLKRFAQWVEASPLSLKLGFVVLTVALLSYPSLIHKLWADATTSEIQRTFDALPVFPSARAAPTTQEMNGLYDPTSSVGISITGWYGTEAGFGDVRRYYERELVDRGWVSATVPSDSSFRASGPTTSEPTRAEFRDRPDPELTNYEIVLATLPSNVREVPAEVAASPTVFAISFKVTDPRLTTQLAWFVDCLFLRAPTFPTCEPMGWNPMESNLDPSIPTMAP
ncbi:MAG: hypothetical protein GEU73_15875 [Chloroflexi bacterium]|nr:hypothetical protein [Chloroflexota bacterium]